MNGNSINLFRRRYGGTFTTHARNGSGRWGDYVELLQGWTGAALTWGLTGYGYNNFYLLEVRDVRV